MKAMKLTSAVLVAGTLSLALAGCSGGAAGGEISAENPVEVSVGSTAGGASAIFLYGIDQGIFAEEGLDLTVEVQQSGGATLPAVMGGHIDFGASALTSIIQARAEGLPILAVAGGTGASEDPMTDISQVLVDPASGIESLADLEGKTLAINGLNTISQLSMVKGISDAGVDPDDVEMVEVGFPDMVATLQQGEIDAATVQEPFLTQGLDAGLVSIGSSYFEPGMAIGGVSTSEKFAAEHPEVVTAMKEAVSRTAKAIADDPESFREFQVEAEMIPAELADRLNLTSYRGEVDLETVQAAADVMVEFGWIDEVPDLDALVWKP
ncbi:ABC transporter substrate-binding protein [Microbacterium sp. NPDC096154]|uniref:ABC transporter substrate-binding protein n=1 Tax=Microbacterium sp. NPDC096154 TaxID=3155549 RepID=UPI003318EFD4